MRILITGSKGQVGSQIVDMIRRGSSEIGEIPAEIKKAEVIGMGSKELDISDLYEVREIIGENKPDVVINAAAYTDVDGCESNEDRAFSVNAYGAKNLAIVCEEIGAKLVHISTDYVFSGVGNKPFNEDDETLPKSSYAMSKDMGDKYVKEFCSKYFIIRPSWVYGYNGKNFVYTIMRLAKEKGVIKVVNDQIGNPTNAEDIAHHVLKLIVTDKYGTYHCAGHGQCSWYDFACRIVELAGIACIVLPCTSDEYPSPTKRPAYSVLENERLRITVGDEMRYWEEALISFFGQINIVK
jgi:dTDP-4-dehydrorhamnose reductase